VLILVWLEGLGRGMERKQRLGAEMKQGQGRDYDSLISKRVRAKTELDESRRLSRADCEMNMLWRKAVGRELVWQKACGRRKLLSVSSGW